MERGKNTALIVEKFKCFIGGGGKEREKSTNKKE